MKCRKNSLERVTRLQINHFTLILTIIALLSTYSCSGYKNGHKKRETKAESVLPDKELEEEFAEVDGFEYEAIDGINDQDELASLESDDSESSSELLADDFYEASDEFGADGGDSSNGLLTDDFYDDDKNSEDGGLLAADFYDNSDNDNLAMADDDNWDSDDQWDEEDNLDKTADLNVDLDLDLLDEDLDLYDGTLASLKKKNSITKIEKGVFVRKNALTNNRVIAIPKIIVTDNSIIKASKVASIEAVKYLVLKKGVNINYQNQKGFTPLIAATSNNRPEIVRFLINEGAKQDIKGPNGKTALDIAKSKGLIRVTTILDGSARSISSKK